MSKYDYTKRLKTLKNEECSIVKREATIVQRSFKYNEKRMKLNTQIEQQLKELNKNRNNLLYLKENNKLLENFIEQEQHRLEECREHIQQMQQAVEESYVRQANARQIGMEQMLRIRCLKETTNTFINFNTLPARVQGVSLNDHGHSTEWLPINFNPSQYSLEEAQSIIWQENSENIESFKRFNAVWDHLFFDFFRNNSQFSDAFDNTLNK